MFFFCLISVRFITVLFTNSLKVFLHFFFLIRILVYNLIKLVFPFRISNYFDLLGFTIILREFFEVCVRFILNQFVVGF